jgi:hypothetical protein
MGENSPKNIQQEAKGEGIAQAAGHGATAIAIFGVPLEKALITFFAASIVFQFLGYCCALNLNDPSFTVTTCGLCYPVFFGLPAFLGFFFGIALKNKKIIFLTLLSGAISVGFIIVLRTIGVGSYFRILDLIK